MSHFDAATKLVVVMDTNAVFCYLMVTVVLGNMCSLQQMVMCCMMAVPLLKAANAG